MMEALKLYELLLVGNFDDKKYFENYFQEVYLIKNNNQALNFYLMYKPSIIFFYSDEERCNSMSIIEKIREHDRETILVLISEKQNIDVLLNLLPLHLSGYIEKPFQKNKVEQVLENIFHDLCLLSVDRVKLKDNYIFHRKEHMLYNREKKEVRLTKNEIKLMTLLSRRKDHYISLEQIEHTIWDNFSAHEDCYPRLKALLYGVRRKLPQNSIVNSYSLGYKLVSS